MAKFKISGVWKNSQGVITHYAFHEVTKDVITGASKVTKLAAVELLKNSSNEAITWIWDYNGSYWKDGEKVEVVSGSYLRSNHDRTVKDNLAHLINYDRL